MNQGEMAGLMKGVAVVIKEHIGSSVAPVIGRIESLEHRSLVPGPQGEKGLDGNHGKNGADGLHGKDGRDGIDGKDGAPGLDGQKGLDGSPGEVGPQGPMGEKGEAGERGPVGEAGPQGEPGQRGEKGLDGVNGKDGADGINGKDGAPGLNGKDGADGLHGKDADEDAIVRRVLASVDVMVQKAISAMPVPRDGRDGLPGIPGAPGERGLDGIGRDGKDGTDALGIDDFDVEYDGERAFTLKWANGDRVKAKTFRMPVPIYRGVYGSEKAYEKDDTTTYGGSLWIAMKDAPGTPGNGDGWKLSVKRGSDAKRTV